MNIRFVQFRKWAGWKIKGTEKVEVPTIDLHSARIFYLVSQLEAPSWGGVQSYDGVGMSAGPIHNIAVHRNGEQGSLIKLLRHLEVNAPVSSVFGLLNRFAEIGWYVAQDGRLRFANNGKKVPGRTIVSELSGPRGVAQRHEPRARGWAVAFHEAFSDPRSFDAQEQFAMDWILNSQEALESEAYHRGFASINDVDSHDAAAMRMGQLGEELDLAMCVYHAHSVNAPGKARQILKALLKTSVSPADLPRRLVRKLGTAKYARWHDTPDNKNRYDRTRLAVSRSKLWSTETVRKLMPKDF